MQESHDEDFKVVNAEYVESDVKVEFCDALDALCLTLWTTGSTATCAGDALDPPVMEYRS